MLLHKAIGETWKRQETLMSLQDSYAISVLAMLYHKYFNSGLQQSIFCPVYPKNVSLSVEAMPTYHW